MRGLIASPRRQPDRRRLSTGMGHVLHQPLFVKDFLDLPSERVAATKAYNLEYLEAKRGTMWEDRTKCTRDFLTDAP